MHTSALTKAVSADVQGVNDGNWLSQLAPVAEGRAFTVSMFRASSPKLCH